MYSVFFFPDASRPITQLLIRPWCMFTIGADGSGGDAFFSIGSSFDPVEVPEWENYDVLLMIDSNDNFDLSTFTGASDEGDSNGWLSNQTLIDSTIISISITDPPENLEIVTY